MLCGAATSFTFLIAGRAVLGLIAAATVPCAASLIGDYFPGQERGRIYGYVLSGQMIGTGVGFIACGELAELWWRLGFWVLLLPSIPLAWYLHKLPEPERGGNGLPAQGRKKDNPNQERLMDRKVREAGIQPRRSLVLDENPGEKSIWWAIKFVLSIPTNTVLIIGTALICS